MDKVKRIFMIDGHALVFRGYFAFINRPMVNSKGVNTSAIYGFCKSLFELILKERPTHLFVAFDPGGKIFRHELYPQYKANRPETPPVIKESIPVIKHMLEACRIPIVIKEQVEADDVIGTLSKRAEQEGFEVFMVTPDKDYGQLVSPNIKIYKPNGQGEGWEILGVKQICDKYGIHTPEQVIDILAIWGDASDNVPGVKGIGEVGARKLIGQYGSVENILEHLPDLSPKLRERFTESKDMLLLSKDLVTIRTHLDLEWNEESYKVSAPGLNPLKELFREYEFNSLMRLLPRMEELFCCPGEAGEMNPAPLRSDILNQRPEVPRQISDVVEQARTAGRFSMAGTPEQLIICTGSKLYITRAQNIKPLLENPAVAKCGFGLKDLFLQLRQENIIPAGVLWDPALMHYLLNPEQSHRPEDLSVLYLDYSPAHVEIKEKSLFDDQSITDDNHIRSLSEETRIAWLLKEPLARLLKQENMEDLYLKIEMPLIEVLAHMEYEGIRVDTGMLLSYGDRLRQEAVQIESQIREYAQDPALNVSSPKQLGIVLFEKLQIDDRVKKGKKQYSTDEETLNALSDRHPIVPLILEYRSLKKLLSSYIESIPLLIDQRTGRIHTTFNQTVTATGRLSSQKPNLQNIPIREERGRELRKAFVPRDKDHLLLSADYSQIELRIMAHMSGDDDFIAAFNQGMDIHSATAAKIFHCTVEEVTPEQRSRAKVANFGIIYGISSFGLASRLQIPRNEARKLIEDYFLHYPKVKAFLDNTIAFAKEKGYVQTLFNRKRYAPDIHASNSLIRGLAERNAINAPIQGTAADIIKIAMVNIHREMKERRLRSRMLLQVHDELVFDVHISEKEEMERLVTRLMENATRLSVPLSVSAGFGLNWLEAH